MTDNSFIPSADLTFDGYKNSLKQFLRQQDRFKDFNFEGSNIGVLIDLLTYNTVNNAFYLNMVGSEAYLDSATLRASIVSRAKELNYTPRSRVSSTCVVSVEVVPNDTPRTIVIPKNYKFRTTNSSGQTLTFVCPEAQTIQPNASGRYIKTDIELREGEVVSEAFEVQSSVEFGYTQYQSRFVLSSENVDVSSIEVEVLQSGTATSGTVFTRAYNVYGLNRESRVFFIRGSGANQYEIEFGDGTIGYALKTGNIIRVSYRDTLGEAGNGRLGFAKTSPIQGYSNITVSVTENASGGAERESNDSIKFNAPRHYQTQERGVIDSDFRSLLIENFPEVQSSHVYGGEKIKKYGSVIVAVKSTAASGRISTSLKKRIKKFLETKTLTTQIFVEDPLYFILQISADVSYDLDFVTTNTNAIKTSIITKLKEYESEFLSQFGVDIYSSKIETTIESADPSIRGCQSNLSLIYQWIPVQVGVAETFQIKPNNALLTTSTKTIAVSTSPFYVLDDSDNRVEVVLRDNREGLLQLYRTSDNGLFANDVGSVDYKTGSVSIKLNVQGYDRPIDFTFALDNRKISIDLNQYCILDAAYISLNMVET